ncbi:hypothetical protein KEG38_47445 [Polyangium jinanense]|uniref:hypothetical protein n=1 Tax=Polyangium jinanense TaxID=2829994 RepID=UPI002340E11F|nr:hypothetical protein [Polyangium jinanense]MDC3961545.1 hypothetical protein [Polyangium jinanense]
MTDWFYKATPTKVSFEDTRDLAVNEGFLCRSAFEGNKSRADNTRHVDFGDLLHLYFTGDGDPKVIGSFQVVGPNKHADPGRFGKCVRGTRLFEVADPVFESRLHAMRGNEGYEPDPVLKKMTGWILLARPDITTPPYAEAPFRYKMTLVRRR